MLTFYNSNNGREVDIVSLLLCPPFSNQETINEMRSENYLPCGHSAHPETTPERRAWFFHSAHNKPTQDPTSDPQTSLSPNDSLCLWNICGQLILIKTSIPVIFICQKQVHLWALSLIPYCSVFPPIDFFSLQTFMPSGILFSYVRATLSCKLNTFSPTSCSVFCVS